MTTFKDFLQWYNNKDVVSTPEAMQKMVQFYHQKENDLLKLGCILPNLANICLHKSTNEKFYPFCETDRDLCQKIREDMTGGPSIVFTRKAVVDKAFIRDSSNICKSIVGIDASQFYPYSRCQDMPTWLYTRWDFDSDVQKCKARHKWSRSFEITAMSYYQETRTECRIESFHTSGNKKNWLFQCRWILWSLQNCVWSNGMLLPFCLCQDTRPSISEKDIERGKKWERLMTWDVSKFAKKITKSKRCGNVSGGKTSKRTKNLRIISDPIFHTKDLSLMILYWEK